MGEGAVFDVFGAEFRSVLRAGVVVWLAGGQDAPGGDEDLVGRAAGRWRRPTWRGEGDGRYDVVG